MKNVIFLGGQFAPKLGGQFGLESGGQFAPKLLVNLHWKWVVSLTVFSRYLKFKNKVSVINSSTRKKITDACCNGIGNLICENFIKIYLFDEWKFNGIQIKLVVGGI